MSGDEEIDPETATKEQNEAASKIQAVHRGRKGRKKAKKKKKEKEDEEERKRDNPKLGDHKHKKGKGGALVDKGAELGEHSLEFMLKMFGNEGGAYLRKGSQRNCRDVPMILSFAMYWGCMLFLYFNAKEKGNIDALGTKFPDTATDVQKFAAKFDTRIQQVASSNKSALIHLEGAMSKAFAEVTANRNEDVGHVSNIDAFIKAYNVDAKPFAWTKSEVHQKRMKPGFADQ